MLFANPFTRPGNWYKGNLHTHSTHSDGLYTPEQVIEFYRTRGYHFLSFTEHRVLTPASRIADDFQVISGIEIDEIDPEAGYYHMIGLGMKGLPPEQTMEATSLKEASLSILKPNQPEKNVPMNETAQLIHEQSGIAFLCHPYWSCQVSKDLFNLKGCFGVEVWNGACEAWDCKGLSVVHWEDMLNSGMHIWGLGTDDCHWWAGRQDAGLGWVWVKAPELSEEAILEALEQGYFYASSGPTIEDIRLEGNEITVRTSPVKAIDIIGSGLFKSRRELAEPGKTITEAKLSGDISNIQYIRVACLDYEGNWAWSNPIFF
jgi:hypothetical protein